MIANGRDAITIKGKEFWTEMETAIRIKVTRMMLRRNPILKHELNMVTIDKHPYYEAEAVERVRKALLGYNLRCNLKAKPACIAERMKRRETVMFGLVCYPKHVFANSKRQAKKGVKNEA